MGLILLKPCNMQSNPLFSRHNDVLKRRHPLQRHLRIKAKTLQCRLHLAHEGLRTVKVENTKASANAQRALGHANH